MGTDFAKEAATECATEMGTWYAKATDEEKAKEAARQHAREESKDQRRKDKQCGWRCAGCGYVSTLPGPARITQHFLGVVCLKELKEFTGGTLNKEQERRL